MSAARAAKRKTPALLTLAFRPFFLCASLWSALALALWIAMLMAGVSPPSRFDPLSWHIHEMLFGFVPAVIAGFILTAIPNWTNRAPIQGASLAWLAILWALGRIACLTSALIPLWLAAGSDLAFLVTLCALAAREICASRNWRNLPILAPIAVLAAANLLMYFEIAGIAVAPGLGWRLGLATIIVLISAMGGRLIPSFTRNWLLNRGATHLPAAHGWIDRLSLGALHAGLIGWAFFPELLPVGALLLVGGVLNFLRLARWRGSATVTEPLLAILHLGYLWVIVGAALLGASLLTNVVPLAAAIHALTAGAIGVMVLAVMTRVSLGHTGRALQADRVTTLIYVMVNLAAVTRIAAAFLTGSSASLLSVSAVLWIAGFALFAAWYAPALCSSRVQ